MKYFRENNGHEKSNTGWIESGRIKGWIGERDYDTDGKKQVLQERLRQALKDEGKDPENYLFEVQADSTPTFQLLIAQLREDITDNSSALERKYVKNSDKVEQRMGALEQQLLENSVVVKQ